MKIREFSVQIWLDAYLSYASFGIKSRFEFLAKRKAIKRIDEGYWLPYIGFCQVDKDKITKIALTERGDNNDNRD